MGRVLRGRLQIGVSGGAEAGGDAGFARGPEEGELKAREEGDAGEPFEGGGPCKGDAVGDEGAGAAGVEVMFVAPGGEGGAEGAVNEEAGWFDAEPFALPEEGDAEEGERHGEARAGARGEAGLDVADAHPWWADAGEVAGVGVPCPGLGGGRGDFLGGGEGDEGHAKETLDER